MKTSHLLLVFTTIIAFLGANSCTENEPYFTQGELGGESSTVDNDAVKAADSFMRVVYGKTRNATSSVKNVEYDLIQSTRSGNSSDTLLTVVNYNDNAGFVLMANTSSGEYSMFGISDTGSLNLSDTTFNDGLRCYLSGVKGQISGPGDDEETLSPETAPEDEIIIKGPYLNPYIAGWHQNWPYNTQCPQLWNNNTQCFQYSVAGCVPVAVAMFMAHHGWPINYPGSGFDWTKIQDNPFSFINNVYNYNEIARLISVLGSKDHLNTKYELDSSGTYVKNVIPVLKKWGYNVNGDWSTSNPLFSSSDSNDNAQPTLVSAKGTSASSGHMWITDGVMRIYHHHDHSGSNYTLEVYCHFIWGWGSGPNGYFKAGQLIGFKGKPNASEVVDLSYLNVNFTDFKYLNGAYPNR